MASLTDELRALAAKAETLADRAERRHGRHDRHTTAHDVFLDVVPAGIDLYASRASDGKWWWYLVMPAEWRPAPGTERQWTVNPSTYRRWQSRTAAPWPAGADDPRNSQENALRVGLAALVATLCEPAPACPPLNAQAVET